jgi:hypothetical protein
MTWLLIGALVWVVVAVPAALLIGRSIREGDARRAVEAEVQLQAEAQARSETPDGNFVATDAPPSEAAPLPWTGPETVPFPPPPGVPRRRPHIIRNPLSRVERSPSHRDSGVL